MRSITPRQMQVLEAIYRLTLQHGAAPSIRDLCAAVGLSSSSTIAGHLKSLEVLGLVRSVPHQPRTRGLTAAGLRVLSGSIRLHAAKTVLYNARMAIVALRDESLQGHVEILAAMAEVLEAR